MACESINMELTANPEYVGIIRLTTSGIANKIGFSIDDIEDIKVAVSEACTNAIKHSLDNKRLEPFQWICNRLAPLPRQNPGKGLHPAPGCLGS